MSTEKIHRIEELFRRQIEKGSSVENAYLLVHSDKLNLHLNIATGSTGEVPANPHQPNYMASVGKLFTATIVGLLFEQGRLSFDDPLSKYLDADLLQGLHVHKGREYTHEMLHELIFTPLGMESSYMLHKSQPGKENQYPTAHFSIDGKVVNNITSYANIDYAGGGVVSPMEDLLTFMQTLVAGQIISKETLDLMKSDTGTLYPSIEYGYGIWKIKTIPLLIPAKYSCWGSVGATGAFLFYHPGLDAYIIGNFNDVSYRVKGLKFMFKVIQKLYKS